MLNESMRFIQITPKLLPHTIQLERLTTGNYSKTRQIYICNWVRPYVIGCSQGYVLSPLLNVSVMVIESLNSSGFYTQDFDADDLILTSNPAKTDYDLYIHTSKNYQGFPTAGYFWDPTVAIRIPDIFSTYTGLD